MNESTGRHLAAVLGAAVLWGTTGTVAHHAPTGASQTVIGLATFAVGGLVLFALDARAVLATARDRSAQPLLAVGAAGVVAYAGFYYWSMALVGVAVGNALALGSGPVFAALLELTLDRRPASGRWMAAMAVCVLGIGLLASAAHAPVGANALAGVLLGLAAGFGYSLYSWAAARLIGRGHGSRAAVAGVFAAASVVLVPAVLVLGLGPLASARGAAVVGYLALVPMAGAYLLFGYGLRRLAASTATTLALAEPVVATLLATTVLHEHLGPAGWTGLTLVLAGVLLTAVAERR